MFYQAPCGTSARLLRQHRPVTHRIADPSPDGEFVYLHTHSEMSLLDAGTGAHRPGFYVLGDPVLRGGEEGGLKPIRGMTQHEGKQDADDHPMVLLAKNDAGYRNLPALTTAARIDSYYGKSCFDKELLAKRLGTS